MDNRPINIGNKPIEVKHSDLERTDESIYRSSCPVCKEGILLVGRDDDFKLSELDICVACGQYVIYTDIQTLREYEGRS